MASGTAFGSNVENVRDHARRVFSDNEPDLEPEYVTPGAKWHAGALGTVESTQNPAGRLWRFTGALPDLNAQQPSAAARGDTVAARFVVDAPHEGELLGIAPQRTTRCSRKPSICRRRQCRRRGRGAGGGPGRLARRGAAQADRVAGQDVIDSVTRREWGWLLVRREGSNPDRTDESRSQWFHSRPATRHGLRWGRSPPRERDAGAELRARPSAQRSDLWLRREERYVGEQVGATRGCFPRGP
jgi:hypothetical protein